jgi:predicted O-methyltransferase YrrM
VEIDLFNKPNFTRVKKEQFPEPHSLDGKKLPPDGEAQPEGDMFLEEGPMPIGLSYPDEVDFGPYIQRCGEGHGKEMNLDLSPDIPYSAGNIHAHTALLLYSLVLNQRPTNVVETGTFYGYSTWFIAEALRYWNEGGMVFTLDPEQELIADCVKEHPNVECIPARSEVSLRPLAEDLQEIHFAFLDSWKRLSIFEFWAVDKFMVPGGIIAFHDTQFLNTGRSLYGYLRFVIKVEQHGYDFVMFSGTPHIENPHQYFGNADDRGLLVLRKREPKPFLNVRDAGTDEWGDSMIIPPEAVDDYSLDTDGGSGE